jgi:hypothetical protein
MLRPRHSPPFVLVALALAGSAIAQDFAVELRYDVRYGPFRVLSMDLTSEITGDRYRAMSTLRTTGVIGRLFPWRSQSESRGRRDGLTLRPTWHWAEGTYRGEHRTIEIDYGPDGGVRARVIPLPEQDGRDVVPEALQQATVDPLTASMLAARTECRGTLPVFDGRRRYDLRLEERASSTVPASRGAVYTGAAKRCRATVEARAGFWRDDPRESEKPTTLDFWIASPGERVPPVPVYLELSGARGTLGAVLVAAHALPAT